MSIRSTGRAPERGPLVHTFSTQTKRCDDRDGTAFPISVQSFRKSPLAAGQPCPLRAAAIAAPALGLKRRHDGRTSCTPCIYALGGQAVDIPREPNVSGIMGTCAMVASDSLVKQRTPTP